MGWKSVAGRDRLPAMPLNTSRLAMVIAVSLALAGLVAWSFDRERQMARCLESGGNWDGRNATCGPGRPGPILQRDLQRT